MNIKIEHENTNGRLIRTLTCSLVGNFPFYTAVRAEKHPNTVSEIVDVWWGYTYLGVIKQIQFEYFQLNFSKPSATLTFDWGSITTDLPNIQRLKSAGRFRKQTIKIAPKFVLMHYKPNVRLMEINQVSYKIAETQTSTIWTIRLEDSNILYHYL